MTAPRVRMARLEVAEKWWWNQDGHSVVSHVHILIGLVLRKLLILT